MNAKAILDKAARLAAGERQVNYGHPRDDFARTAAMLNGLFRDRLISPFAASDVPLIMICVKLSRHVHARKEDNIVDIIGYALTDAMLDEGKETPCLESSIAPAHTDTI